MPNKNQSIFWKRGLCRFRSVQSFWWFPYKLFLKSWKGWPMPRKPRHKLFKMLLSPSKNIALSCARLVSLLWEVREIDLREVLPVLVVILVVFSVFCFSNVNALQNLRSGLGQCVWSFLDGKTWQKTIFINDAFLLFFFVEKLFLLLFLGRSSFYRRRMRSEIPESVRSKLSWSNSRKMNEI